MPRPDRKPVKEQKAELKSKPKLKSKKEDVVVKEPETLSEIAEAVKESAPSLAVETKVEHKTYPPLETKPDFRALPDPEKTLRRVAWVSGNEFMTHGEKSTAIAFLLLFEGKPDRTQITISAHLNKSTGYSPQVVRTVLDILTDWGLLKREIIKKKGTDVTLLF